MVTTYTSFAQTPNIITYQGKLTQQGTDVSGERTITARLYGDADGTEKVWEGTYKTYITDGIFALPLGTGKYPLPAPTKLDKPLWVGITVDGIELRPFTQLTSSPYALNVADKSITKAKLADDVLLGIVGGQNQQSIGTTVLLGGNLYDRAPGVEYIGSNSSTTGSKQVWFKTDDVTALRLSHSTATSGTPNIIGGYSGNVIDSAYKGSVISGGGESGSVNTILNDFGFIGGGRLNTIGNVSLTHVGQVIGGGETNTAVGNLSFIGSGEGNLTFNDAEHSAIVGGHSNEVRKAGSFIGGGFENHAYSLYTVIGGGASNVITGLSENSAILGGASNHIDAYYSAIGGGDQNKIWANGGSLPKWSIIGGGLQNEILSSDYYSTIGGGYSNFIDKSSSSVISGGYDNNVKEGHYNVIAGGYSNQINTLSGSYIFPSWYSFIGGGYNNLIDSYSDENQTSYSVIVGGKDNYTLESRVFIGGGESNLADEDYAVVTGGKENHARGYYGFAGGGYQNKVGTSHGFASYSGISSGSQNIITNDYSFIGGGAKNTATGKYSFVGGGGDETAATASNQATATRTVVVGGSDNIASAARSFIGGGNGNRATGVSSVIVGGENNKTQNTSSTVAGGFTNQSLGPYSSIGGGDNNTVTVFGSQATIPGGDHLKAESYAQTSMGAYNNSVGTSAIHQFRGQQDIPAIPDPTRIAHINNALVMVGNGYVRPDATTRRENAFEVINRGATIVYGNLNDRGPDAPTFLDQNNPSKDIGAAPVNTTADPAIYGATYQDNLLIAWGDVSDQVDANNNSTIHSSFGVKNIKWDNVNQLFEVTLNNAPSTRDLNTNIGINKASITATVATDFDATSAHCHSITVSQIQNNVFHVFIHDIQAACNPVRVPFMFKVVGRR